MKPLTKKQLKLKAETIADQMFKAEAQFKTFNVMNLGRVLDAPRNVILAGGSEDEALAAIKVAIEKYEVKS